ncbi:11602_t:CDS:2 [Scutellospora calospora]|uniref:11602_t:CDS:1 n=1 Tax=Scutellospora calospora TaxID=85575 RepID=A0ACA9L205_9GLOM|nr:11602_t:CDS:2 [Scutellospora calospora]
MSKKLRIESQEINSESETDNGFEENASINNRTESKIDLSTENLQEVESDLTYMVPSTATSMATSHKSSWYEVPCRQTIKNEIMKWHKSMEEKIKEELATTQKVSITCNIWSSITMQSYLGVTVHYVNKEWKLRQFLLDLCYFPEQHTAIRIQELLLDILDDTNISSKLLGLTTDNAKSMIAIGRDLKTEFASKGNKELIHQRCAAHILNIALENVLELKPDLDINTRWNSTFLMINKFLKMRNLFDILVAKHRDLSPLYLQDDNWNRLKVMIDILHRFFDATEILSTSTYPTISDVRLTIFGLIRHLDFFLEDSLDDNDYLFIESINSKLNEYWNYIEESTTISTLLDPRSKTKTFTTTKQHDFPVLATMASCYLSIQGSSVPSEQAFSIAANVITKIHCNLKPESARTVMRLKSWILKICDKQDNENDLDVEILSES